MSLQVPDIVIAGHVCRDVVDDPPGWRPGGAAYYAAAAASRLGYSVGVVTAGAEELEALRTIPNAVVVGLEARVSTSFQNRYERTGRKQRLIALAPAIPTELVPPEWRKAPVALLAPVADEVPAAMARLFPRALIGVLAQGYMRRLAVGEEVRVRAWSRALEVLPLVAAAIFSEEDIRGQPASWLGFCGPLLVMTRGHLGCDVIHCGKRRHVAAFATAELDPTGAGDVFGAAFMLRLQETREPLDAARFATCAASFAVEGKGTEGLPSMDHVQHRLNAWKPS